MLHIRFTESNDVPVVLLCSPSSFKTELIQKNYLSHLDEKGIIAVNLEYNENNKAPVKDVALPFLTEELLPTLVQLETKLILVNDAHYFKILTKERKVTLVHGTVFPCKISGFEQFNVSYIPSATSAYYNPDIKEQILFSLNKINDYLLGTLTDAPTINIKKLYREQLAEITQALNELSIEPKVFVDIEGFSLNFWEAGIATFALAKDSLNSVAIQCDYVIDPEDPNKGIYSPCLEIRELFKNFLINYKGELVFHNCYYDLESIIFTLFMDGWSDIDGRKNATDLLGNKTHDTRLIAYLSLNGTSRPKLDLKTLAYPYLGNYGIDVTDIRLQSLDDLLHYNGMDTLATAYVYGKYYPIMVADKQEDIYKELFKGGIPLYLDVEMTGLPLNPETVKEVTAKLTTIQADYLAKLHKSPVIIDYTDVLMRKESDKMHSKWKQKTAPIEAFNYIKFKPSSPVQLCDLIYNTLEYPVLDKTKSGNPSTKTKHLEKLLNITTDAENKELLTNLIGYKELSTIMSIFINAFNNKVVDKGDGRVYLHSSFNQAGTVSGRLSSANVNLQNIPSTGTDYASLIKSCIDPPPGYLFVGADFASLEDRISALTTKDENKLKIYIDGFDGHSLRAYSYFTDQMPDIDPNSVESINSIADKYKQLRQDSKPITFLKTYKGKAYGLMHTVGLDKDTAERVDKAYHELYKTSDEWVNAKLKQATEDGYATVAFGLRVRCEALKGIYLDIDRLPPKLEALTRTIANAFGQSYGLLNNRAGISLRKKAMTSPFKNSILFAPHIHDAQYFLIKEDIAVLEWLNNELVTEMCWQNLPEIQHPIVGLGGQLDIFYPTWAKSVSLPNNATQDEIKAICLKHAEELKNP